MTKKILGLDIGTNSIGGALINIPKNFDDYGKEGNIEWIGSRVIPMDGDYLQKFESGAQAETKAAFRRGKRGSRRLKHRYKLRRTRLIKVFKALEWLNEDFPLDDSRKFKKDINENGYSLKISAYMPFSEKTIKEFEKELGIEGKTNKKNKSIVSEDWIIYYLRKKALKEEITIPELVRIIYMFNQRRGFKSSRKDLKDTNVLPYNVFLKRKEQNDFGENGIETQFVSITKIKSITFKEERKGKKGNITNVYTIEAEDQRMLTWEEERKNKPDWANDKDDKGKKIEKKEFTYLVVQKIDKNGKHSQNKPQLPKDDDWALCTTALSEKIEEKKQHPGEYFFEQLKEAYKAKRSYKIRQYPVHRWRYHKELEAIWKKQCEHNLELNKLNSDKKTLTKLAEILYPTQVKNNMQKLAEFQSKDLLHIISNDIIYYQRELKSQKSLIRECRYEKRKGIDGEFYGLKCIPRSSPLFQEFRIWQDIHNIKVLKKEEIVDGKTKIDVDVTNKYINENIKEKLFGLFQSQATISEKRILNLLKENNTTNDIIISDKKDGERSHSINLFRNCDSLKGNETLSRYRSIFKEAEFNGEVILNDKEKLMKLWHIDYSITSSDIKKSMNGITTALTNLLPDNANKLIVIEAFCKLSELKKEYGSYSACAIKKLLPVMRCGEYWKEQDISETTKKRAEQIKERLNNIDKNIKRLNEVSDDDVQKQVLKSFIGKDDLTKELNTYQAGYLIYDKHSEKDKTPINSVEELTKYIQKEIPNNSLRNPVVEQVVRETMFLVRDIWSKFGEIDEIHIELGRELKKNSEDKFKEAEKQKINNEENQRIKKLLYELMNGGFDEYVDKDESKTFEFNNGTFKWNMKKEKNKKFEIAPNPESPSDIEKFRIWKENSLVHKNVLIKKKNGEKYVNIFVNKDEEFEKLYKDGNKERIPTREEIKKYALWLSQNCRSPYTGKIIPLSKLFDNNQYEIEHVIPRAKMKNDSFNNLVISEWGVNKAKDKSLAANFISESEGKCKYGGIDYKLFTYEEYEAYCKNVFKFQKGKLKNLLATDVPEDFVERQLNDTRYIGKKLAELLTPIVKNKSGIIFTGGSITFELKNNWGLNKVWKKIILSRFERLEEITGNEYIIHDKDEFGNPVIHFNVKENPELDTKRIDHRHHALDALIIAATTREHIRYLNTLNAADTDDEIKKIRLFLVKHKIRDFKLPWDKFTEQAKNKLEELVVSYKINNKIISKPNNKTAYFKIEEGKVKKDYKEQKANPKWMSVRKSMFKEPQGIIYLKEIYEEKNINKAIEIQIDRMLVQNTPDMKISSYVYDQNARKIIKGLIERIGIPIQEKDTLLKEIKNQLKKNPLKDLSGKKYKTIVVAKFEEYATKRVTLDKSFDDKKIDKIPYAKIRKSVLGKLLHEHLNSKEFKNEEGKQDPLKAFSNVGLEILAKKTGRSITKVTIYEKKDESSKFGKQYVETDAGSNVYFVMYENQKTKERGGFKSIPTHKAIEKIIKGELVAEDRDGFNKIILSPGDLVYVPTKEQKDNKSEIDWNNKKEISERIYQVRKFSKKQCYFLKSRISDLIIPYESKSKIGEYGSQNLSEKSDDDLKIIDFCIKLKVDRLGNIKPDIN